MSVNAPAAPARRKWFIRYVAVPNEHGSWVFLFVPLVIGLVAGGRFVPASAVLIAASLGAFLLRQPVTAAVKSLSGRRPTSELPVAALWIGIYGLITLAAVLALVQFGYGFLLWLAVPALPVLGWHLWLVSRKAERRQIWVEIAGSGALALTAPAAYWIGQDQISMSGWLLWVLCWMQSAGTIVYAYLRLEQRRLKEQPTTEQQWKMGQPAVWVNTAIFAVSLVFAVLGWIPKLLPLAFAIQPIEAVWGTFRPAFKVKPARIGVRQLIFSVLFAVLFLLFWI